MIFTREVSAASSRLRRRHDLVQHAVDAEPDPEHLLVGLEVDVRGAAANGVDQDHVHEPDHRRLVGRLLEVEDVGLGEGLLAALDDLDVGVGPLELAHHVGDALAGRL